MNIAESITQYFLNKDAAGILNKENISSFNYMENNFLTSIEFIEMVAEFEQQFTVAFSDENLKSKDFSIVGGLIKMVERLSEE